MYEGLDLGKVSPVPSEVSLLASTLWRIDRAAYGRTLAEVSRRLDTYAEGGAVPRATPAQVKELQELCTRAAPAEQVAPLRAVLDRKNWALRHGKLQLAPAAFSEARTCIRHLQGSAAVERTKFWHETPC
jgi:hypothetical protein